MLRIQLLGSFRLWFSRQPDASGGDAPPVETDQVASPRIQSLLAYLLLHEGPQSRQQLAYLFWPESTESQARTNLRNLVYQLRQRLPESDRYLSFDVQTIQWKTDAPFDCDVLELRRSLVRGEENPLEHQTLAKIGKLYAGELLPDCYDDWIIQARSELHDAVMQSMGHLLALQENRRDYDRAIATARQLLAMDPLDEETNRRLMRLRALNNERAGALQQYHELVALLRRELDVEPDEETLALHDRIASGTLQESPVAQDIQFPEDQPQLVGRQVEWLELQRLWQNSLRGHPRLVLISGVAGIGKTRLAEELLRWVGNQGARVARARSYATQGAMAYAPVADLLRTPSLHARVERLGDQWLTPLARILPELLDNRPDLHPPAPMTESWQRHQLQEALVHATVADAQPLLILLDDLQWCDAETLGWAERLIRSSAGRRLLVVGTVRDDEVDDQHPLAELQTGLQRDDRVAEITLEPLNIAETVELAHLMAESTLNMEEGERLFRETEGNPLFVVETVRAHEQQAGESDARAVQTGLPPKVYAVIKSRLALLSAEAQRLASLAAVIGRSFTFDVLRAASGDDEDALLDCLDDLIQRYIIREHQAGLYDFSHDRLRDVAYVEISQTRRRVLHRRVGEAIERIHAEKLDERSGSLAEHFLQAGEIVRSIDYLQRAGQWAAARYANADALAYYTRALALLPDMGGTQCLDLLLAREQILRHLIMTDAWDQDLIALENLVDAFKSGSLEENRYAATVYIRRSEWYVAQADFDQALHYARAAVRLAETTGDAALEADAFRQSGYAHFIHGNMHASLAEFRQTLTRANAAGNSRLEADALEWHGAIGMYTGMLIADILDCLERAMEIHRRSQDLGGQAEIHNKFAYALIAQGEDAYHAAHAHIEEGLRLSEQIGHNQCSGRLQRNLGWLYTYTGDFGKADEALRISLDNLKDVTFTAASHSYLGLNYLNAADYKQAKAQFEAALQNFATVEQSRPHLTITLVGLSLLNSALGQYETALEYGQQALQSAELRDDSRHAAAARTCMGHALLGMSELSESKESYRQARKLYLEMEQFNRSMEPLAGLAQVALLTGDLDQAGGHVEEILSHIDANKLDRTEEVFKVYLACTRVLTRLDDPRAGEVRQLASAQLEARANSLLDDEQRWVFWALPQHQEAAEVAIQEGQPGTDSRLLDGQSVG